MEPWDLNSKNIKGAERFISRLTLYFASCLMILKAKCYFLWHVHYPLRQISVQIFPSLIASIYFHTVHNITKSEYFIMTSNCFAFFFLIAFLRDRMLTCIHYIKHGDRPTEGHRDFKSIVTFRKQFKMLPNSRWLLNSNRNYLICGFYYELLP